MLRTSNAISLTSGTSRTGLSRPAFFLVPKAPKTGAAEFFQLTLRFFPLNNVPLSTDRFFLIGSWIERILDDNFEFEWASPWWKLGTMIWCYMELVATEFKELAGPGFKFNGLALVWILRPSRSGVVVATGV